MILFSGKPNKSYTGVFTQYNHTYITLWNHYILPHHYANQGTYDSKNVYMNVTCYRFGSYDFFKLDFLQNRHAILSIQILPI